MSFSKVTRHKHKSLQLPWGNKLFAYSTDDLSTHGRIRTLWHGLPVWLVSAASARWNFCFLPFFAFMSSLRAVKSLSYKLLFLISRHAWSILRTHTHFFCRDLHTSFCIPRGLCSHSRFFHFFVAAISQFMCPSHPGEWRKKKSRRGCCTHAS